MPVSSRLLPMRYLLSCNPLRLMAVTLVICTVTLLIAFAITDRMAVWINNTEYMFQEVEGTHRKVSECVCETPLKYPHNCRPTESPELEANMTMQAFEKDPARIETSGAPNSNFFSFKGNQRVPGPIFETPDTNCPELKAIPNLVNDREMNLTNEVPMTVLERMICPEQSDRMENLVSNGNLRVQAPSVNSATNSSSSAGKHLILNHLSALEIRCGNYLYLPGGHWRPATCLPRWKVAIIVPYRQRSFQLSIFLRYIIPFLQKQLLEFAIYIVNQANDLPFNRGMLLNVGFVESLNFSRWDCFIFHDVDHLPQSEFNPYGCVDLPRHFISGADNRKYKVPYSTSFGGVNGFTVAQFKTINGFGNVYWGWCCEDDDLERRVRAAKLAKTRYTGAVGYYKAIIVHHDKVKTGREQEQLNRASLKTLTNRLKTDGLSNLRYRILQVELHTLYTNISVDIQKLQR